MTSSASFDLDDFKSINDAHGHLVGDAVLARTAAQLQAQLRPGDLLALYGGEEFCIVLPDTSEKDAEQIAERLRMQLAAADWSDLHHTLTASFGVSLRHAEEFSLEQTIARADAALYRAKRAGRNRVEGGPEAIAAREDGDKPKAA